MRKGQLLAPMRRIVLAAVLIVIAALPASASIAVFVDGRNMKIDSYKMIDDETMQLGMKGGGSVTLPDWSTACT